MPRVFINYRTVDAVDTAVLIDRELCRRFGPDTIFLAGRSIPAGEKFEPLILQAVRRCAVLVVLIGARWLEAPGVNGGRAIDDPEDWVHREIVEAMRNGVTVMPVLLNRARIAPDALPAAIADLASYQQLTYSHRTADDDLARLAKELSRAVPGLRRADRTGKASPRATAGPGPEAPPGSPVYRGNNFLGATTVEIAVAGDMYLGDDEPGDDDD
ncbi:TIR domain-containing protein [Streptomyces sp. NBC_01262]|uniref:TIR domain-containing protein n=1 Tax=Streptomyces sp. NBC_01262 TaxID=2903803 RepID=UPI002E35A7A5|nr:TIR domain-containing protein [Streptomyces sp. NBC_01262]